MRKHNRIHILGAPHYKARFRFLRKLKDFKCALWSEKYVKSCIQFFNISTIQLCPTCDPCDEKIL